MIKNENCVFKRENLKNKRKKKSEYVKKAATIVPLSCLGKRYETRRFFFYYFQLPFILRSINTNAFSITLTLLGFVCWHCFFFYPTSTIMCFFTLFFIYRFTYTDTRRFLPGNRHEVSFHRIAVRERFVRTAVGEPRWKMLCRRSTDIRDLR